MIRDKIKKWLNRYLLAEIIGTFCALFFSITVYAVTKNNVLAAIAAAWTETIAFFGTIIIRDIKHSKLEHKNEDKKYTIFSLLLTIRDIVFEFGFSEILDTYALRPFFMFIFPILLGNRVIGVLVGKVVSDIFYYGPAIIIYELRERHKNKKRS